MKDLSKIHAWYIIFTLISCSENCLNASDFCKTFLKQTCSLQGTRGLRGPTSALHYSVKGKHLSEDKATIVLCVAVSLFEIIEFEVIGKNSGSTVC